MSLLSILLVGCRGYDSAIASFSNDTGYASGESADDSDGALPSDETDDGLGSEDEETLLGLRPATTDAYVFVANADRNTVTRIEVSTLDVLTATVGVRPSLVLTSPDYTRAVTFNAGSDSVSVVDAATLAVSAVEIQRNLNAMAMSPDGRWVICYHDPDAEDGDDFDGSISYNEISIVDLETLTHHEAVVGTFPHSVQFTDDSMTAAVISDDYLALITLDPDGPSTSRVALSEDTIDPPVAEEVLLDPAGRYAIVRQYGVDELVLVDIEALSTSMLPVGDNPTDMDLSADGARALVVARTAGQIWSYDLADPEAFPEVIDMPPGEVFGSLVVSPDGSRGLLYSTASGQARYGVWDIDAGTVDVMGLVKPVSSMGVSPDGGTALIFHSLDNGDIDPSSEFYDHHAVTLVDLSDLFSNPIRLESEPIAYDNSDDGETGFVITEGGTELLVLHYASLLHDQVGLPSEPVYLGVLPESETAYVSQVHSLGRISFFDALSEELQTITGFELNAAIEQ